MLVLSDSCHSGSVVKVAPDNLVEGVECKVIPRDVLVGAWREREGMYQLILDEVAGVKGKGARGLHDSDFGCRDNEKSWGDQSFGFFYGGLVGCLESRSFPEGNYKEFHKDIGRRVEEKRSPPAVGNSIPITCR